MTEITRLNPETHYTSDEATYSGPFLADVTCPTGSVYVTVDPAVTVAGVRVLTRDDTNSPAADAVRGARISQSGERLVVVVPEVKGSGSTMTFGGGTTVINGVSYSGNVTVVNGSVIGGNMSGTVSHGVEVYITLPAGSGVRSRTKNASLHTHGPVAAIEAETTNGSIKAETVGRLKADAGNGSVKVGRVAEWIDAEASNGSVKVDEYAGSACRVRAGNGSVNLTAVPVASGRLDVKVGNGSVKLYGVRGRTDLEVNASAGNGTVKKL